MIPQEFAQSATVFPLVRRSRRSQSVLGLVDATESNDVLVPDQILLRTIVNNCDSAGVTRT